MSSRSVASATAGSPGEEEAARLRHSALGLRRPPRHGRGTFGVRRQALDGQTPNRQARSRRRRCAGTLRVAAVIWLLLVAPRCTTLAQTLPEVPPLPRQERLVERNDLTAALRVSNADLTAGELPELTLVTHQPRQRAAARAGRESQPQYVRSCVQFRRRGDAVAANSRQPWWSVFVQERDRR